MLEFCQIGKRFFGVPVLQDICLRVAVGRTLGLVGENGAGKSTLMNILGGNLVPDQGFMVLEERPFRPRDPQEAARHGVAFIHQELNLFTNLSIEENLFISGLPRRGVWPWVQRRVMREKARALLRQVGLDVTGATLVERLSAGERQLVEIAKALGQEARLIIFDEPTTSLTSQEAAHLFSIMQGLRERGVSMIYISHNLEDVLRVSDDIAVLRDGRLAGAGPRSEFTADRLVTLMVGRSLGQRYPRRSAGPRKALALEVEGLTQPGVLRDVSFALRQGEILGVAGLMGSGRSELARILFGLDPYAAGTIRLMGRRLSPSPRRAIGRRMAYLTEDRRADGLCLEASIADNLVLVTLPRQAAYGLGWLDARQLAGKVAAIREAVRLTPGASSAQAVRTLSGGNQQKVVLAKWLLQDPAVFILDEPTRGIDVGAKFEIYTLLNRLAEQGTGLLFISSEIEELMGMCDRILVMRRGEVRDEVGGGGFDQERILRSALGRREGGRRGGDEGRGKGEVPG